jgi:multicomponent K+:H+ antiporter subunit E
LLGALLGWAVPLYTARFWPEQVKVRRPQVLVRFLLVVLYDIVVANVTVARLIMGPAERMRPAFVTMPLELRSDVAISLLASTISLTPGTVSVFLSADRRCLVIHSLHTTEPDELVATIRRRYERPLKEVLEGC